VSATPTELSLDFLWLELTNRCNLRCVHCYTDSHSGSGYRDVLTTQDYENTMRQAFDLGCRQLQFIGGEPQLHRDFLSLLKAAKAIGFDFIEVFSNLTFLSDDTIRYAAENQVRFATSVYSDTAAEHDAITKVRSSHTRTIANLEKLIANGVTTRAGVIAIDQPPETVERTTRFLREMGVSRVRTSTVREFGRGEEVLGRTAQMSGLCGHCWSGKLCVTPDGNALACVMSREWPVGNVLETSLEGIVRGEALRSVRISVYEEVWRPAVTAKGQPAENCPQSCDPSVCGPDFCEPSVSCPQSCEPPIIECEPGDCAPDALQ
jgi:MoaA/NifB/PqqE/SkfB family radical SAM enzyme